MAVVRVLGWGIGTPDLVMSTMVCPVMMVARPPTTALLASGKEGLEGQWRSQGATLMHAEQGRAKQGQAPVFLVDLLKGYCRVSAVRRSRTCSEQQCRVGLANRLTSQRQHLLQCPFRVNEKISPGRGIIGVNQG